MWYWLSSCSTVFMSMYFTFNAERLMALNVSMLYSQHNVPCYIEQYEKHKPESSLCLNNWFSLEKHMHSNNMMLHWPVQYNGILDTEVRNSIDNLFFNHAHFLTIVCLCQKWQTTEIHCIWQEHLVYFVSCFRQ